MDINQWTGAASDNDVQKRFKRFDDETSNPVTFIEARMLDVRRNGRRRPNKLALGIETFTALKSQPKIVERVKFSGATQNPAVVKENVPAQIFDV